MGLCDPGPEQWLNVWFCLPVSKHEAAGKDDNLQLNAGYVHIVVKHFEQPAAIILAVTWFLQQVCINLTPDPLIRVNEIDLHSNRTKLAQNKLKHCQYRVLQWIDTLPNLFLAIKSCFAQKSIRQFFKSQKRDFWAQKSIRRCVNSPKTRFWGPKIDSAVCQIAKTRFWLKNRLGGVSIRQKRDFGA